MTKIDAEYRSISGAAIYGRRLVTTLQRGVMLMVTYDALFAYSLVIIGVIGLVIQIYKRK